MVLESKYFHDVSCLVMTVQNIAKFDCANIFCYKMSQSWRKVLDQIARNLLTEKDMQCHFTSLKSWKKKCFKSTEDFHSNSSKCQDDISHP